MQTQRYNREFETGLFRSSHLISAYSARCRLSCVPAHQVSEREISFPGRKLDSKSLTLLLQGPEDLATHLTRLFLLITPAPISAAIKTNPVMETPIITETKTIIFKHQMAFSVE